MHSFNGRYLCDNYLVINEWVFEKKNDIKYICQRSSGASDYIAEWWFINNKYQLKFIAYHESPDFNALEHGTLLCEVDTIYDVLTYCATHLHPELP